MPVEFVTFVALTRVIFDGYVVLVVLVVFVVFVVFDVLVLFIFVLELPVVFVVVPLADGVVGLAFPVTLKYYVILLLFITSIYQWFAKPAFKLPAS